MAFAPKRTEKTPLTDGKTPVKKKVITTKLIKKPPGEKVAENIGNKELKLPPLIKESPTTNTHTSPTKIKLDPIKQETPSKLTNEGKTEVKTPKAATSANATVTTLASTSSSPTNLDMLASSKCKHNMRKLLM